MADGTGTAVSHLRWPGTALLPPAARAALTGVGQSAASSVGIHSAVVDKTARLV
jgi:hypothetical protein